MSPLKEEIKENASIRFQNDIKNDILRRYDYISLTDCLKEYCNLGYSISEIKIAYKRINWDFI